MSRSAGWGGATKASVSATSGRAAPALVNAFDEALLADFGALETDLQRQRFLAEHPWLAAPPAVAGLNDLSRRAVRVNFTQALRLADAALYVAENIGDDEGMARSFRSKANALYISGQSGRAVTLHARALAIFRQQGNASEEALTLSASVQPLLLLGRYDAAFRAAQQARDFFARVGDRRRLSRLDINIGNILHRQDRFEKALEYYERALQQLLIENDSEGTAGALSNISVCLISLNDFHRALAANQRARELSAQHGMPLLVVQADYNIAYLYYMRGEYGRALQMLQTARRDFEKNGDAYHAALCHLDLAEIHLELNLNYDAEQLAQTAATQFNQLGFGYEAAKAIVYLAIALHRQGKSERVLDLLADARQRFAREHNHVWPALVDLYQAMVLAEGERLEQAEALALAALRRFRRNFPDKATLCRLLLARLALRGGNIHAARRWCRAAELQLQKLETPALTYQAHFLRGTIEAAAGRRQKAHAIWLAARSALEHLRGGLRNEELKVAFLKNKCEVYERLVEMTLSPEVEPAIEPRDRCRTGFSLSSRFEEAFRYIEEAKSRSLMELMRGQMHLPRPDSAHPPAVRARELRDELNWYYHRIEEVQLQPHGGQLYTQLLARLRSREAEYGRLLRELPAHEADRHAPLALPIQQIQAAINPGVLLVEYFRAGERLLVATLSRESINIAPVADTATLQEHLALLQLQLSKFRLGPSYVARFGELLMAATHSHLKALHRLLIEPLGELQAEHVIFVPHEELHRLPFHALFDGSSYLVERVSVSYAPSASIYALCARKQVNVRGPALVLGLSDERAPAVEHEARVIASMLPNAMLFTGEQATGEVLRRHGPASRLIHVATHGYFREDNPRFSGLRLADGYLSTYDLSECQLPASLVVLSGCATGATTSTAGDELLGLERALLSAGARSLLLSLWDIDDQTTDEFMQAFHTNVKGGVPYARAVRSAAATVRSTHPHPYFWAPFFVVGQP